MEVGFHVSSCRRRTYRRVASVVLYTYIATGSVMASGG